MKKSLPDLFLTKLNSRRIMLANNLGVRSKYFGLRTSLNPIYTSFLDTEFKLTYKNNLKLKKSVTPNSTQPVTNISGPEKLKLFKTFKSFLRVTSASSSTLMIPHFSFKHFYLGYKRGGLILLNINKLFSR